MAPSDGSRTLERWCTAVTFVLAVLVYLNSLPAGFAFDDNFAIVRSTATSTACLHIYSMAA